MLKITRPDGNLPETQEAALLLVNSELASLDNYLTEQGQPPSSSYEKAMVRTYLLAKLCKRIENPG